jgi:hypothetical protein
VKLDLVSILERRQTSLRSQFGTRLTSHENHFFAYEPERILNVPIPIIPGVATRVLLISVMDPELVEMLMKGDVGLQQMIAIAAIEPQSRQLFLVCFFD